MGYEGFDCICRWPIFCWRESCECLLGGIGGVSVPGPKVRRSIRDEPALCRLFPKKNSTFTCSAGRDQSFLFYYRRENGKKREVST